MVGTVPQRGVFRCVPTADRRCGARCEVPSCAYTSLFLFLSSGSTEDVFTDGEMSKGCWRICVNPVNVVASRIRHSRDDNRIRRLASRGNANKESKAHAPASSETTLNGTQATTFTVLRVLPFRRETGLPHRQMNMSRERPPRHRSRKWSDEKNKKLLRERGGRGRSARRRCMPQPL